MQAHRWWGRRPALVAAAVAIAAAAILGVRGLESDAIPGQPPGATADPFDYAPGNVGVMVIGTPLLLYQLPQLSGLGAAWAVGSCTFDNMLTRWDGRRFVVARHPPDRYRPASLPHRFRLGGHGCTSQ